MLRNASPRLSPNPSPGVPIPVGTTRQAEGFHGRIGTLLPAAARRRFGRSGPESCQPSGRSSPLLTKPVGSCSFGSRWFCHVGMKSPVMFPNAGRVKAVLIISGESIRQLPENHPIRPKPMLRVQGQLQGTNWTGILLHQSDREDSVYMLRNRKCHCRLV